LGSVAGSIARLAVNGGLGEQLAALLLSSCCGCITLQAVHELGDDPAFQQAQNDVVASVYYLPSQHAAQKLGLK
jgi:hypothetical protein